jgi:hypothetical protein
MAREGEDGLSDGGVHGASLKRDGLIEVVVSHKAIIMPDVFGSVPNTGGTGF